MRNARELVGWAGGGGGWDLCKGAAVVGATIRRLAGARQSAEAAFRAIRMSH